MPVPQSPKNLCILKLELTLHPTLETLEIWCSTVKNRDGCTFETAVSSALTRVETVLQQMWEPKIELDAKNKSQTTLRQTIRDFCAAKWYGAATPINFLSRNRSSKTQIWIFILRMRARKVHRCNKTQVLYRPNGKEKNLESLRFVWNHKEWPENSGALPLCPFHRTLQHISQYNRLACKDGRSAAPSHRNFRSNLALLCLLKSIYRKFLPASHLEDRWSCPQIVAVSFSLQGQL